MLHTMLVFALAAAVIGVAGTRLTRVAVALAHRTRMGQALFGALFLGGVTSLPGISATSVAALDGHIDLALGNAVGGIAAQTVFLVVADAIYARANLEHAAASATNLAQGILLIALLALPLLATLGPDVSVLGLHPLSLGIVLGFVFGMRLIRSIRDDPMWYPAHTADTVTVDHAPPPGPQVSLRRLWLNFTGLSLLVALAGMAISRAGADLAQQAALSETAVGTYLTGTATSLPELVTVLAAVRGGALTLAVADILGGNCFDVTFLAVADLLYRSGSAYHDSSGDYLFMVALTILMTAALSIGLLRRERHGWGNIGFEGVAVIAIYLASAALLLFDGS